MGKYANRSSKHMGDPCSQCGRTDVDFYARTSHCKACHAGKHLPGYLKKTYGITMEKFTSILSEQDGKCAICKTDDWGNWTRPVVDHDHVTGKVRGLLCHKCNSALGLFRDSKDVLLSALTYLDVT